MSAADSPAVAILKEQLHQAPRQHRGYWHSRIRAQRLKEARDRGTHTSEQWVALLDHFYWRCVRCGAEDVTLQKDHVIPVYQGGSDGIDNLQPLCTPCNAGKGSERKNWAAYRDEHGFADVEPTLDEAF